MLLNCDIFGLLTENLTVMQKLFVCFLIAKLQLWFLDEILQEYRDIMLSYQLKSSEVVGHILKLCLITFHRRNLKHRQLNAVRLRML